ncbi:hypothetical protein FB45DRAFT_935688, partial [Roridomyces roridus]
PWALYKSSHACLLQLSMLGLILPSSNVSWIICISTGRTRKSYFDSILIKLLMTMNGLSIQPGRLALRNSAQ